MGAGDGNETPCQLLLSRMPVNQDPPRFSDSCFMRGPRHSGPCHGLTRHIMQKKPNPAAITDGVNLLISNTFNSVIAVPRRYSIDQNP